MDELVEYGTGGVARRSNSAVVGTGTGMRHPRVWASKTHFVVDVWFYREAQLIMHLHIASSPSVSVH